MTINQWTDTNKTESHLRRGGRIVGKIRRGYDQDGKQWSVWQCQIHTPRLRTIAFRKSKTRAKLVVELVVARLAAKEKHA